MNTDNTDNEPAIAANAARVHQIIDEVLRRRDAGEDLPDQTVLNAHPELASKLAGELDKLRRIRVACAAADAMSQSGVGASPSDPGGGVPPTMGIGLAARILVPGYRLMREIAFGGQAVVYEAVQQSTGRKVAVKLIKDGHLASPRDRARFDREVQIMAALEHPNIVGIIDRGVTQEGLSFIVMDFIVGRPLDTYLGMSPGSEPHPAGDPAAALRLFLKVCDAVNAAHLRGVIHRDLKPSNVLVSENGEPHILDFGLARMAISAMTDEEHPQAVTITGQFIGSLPWASPEQAEGVSNRIDMRTDVYSLGVMLYQVLTGGKFPYEVVGTVHEVLHNILTAQPAPPSHVLAAAQAKQEQNKRRYRRRHPAMINPAIEAVVLKALSKRREDRYQTAGELARDIANYLAGRPTMAGGAGGAGGVLRRKMPWGWVAALAASIVAVAAVVTTWYMWSLLTLANLTRSSPAGSLSPSTGMAGQAQHNQPMSAAASPPAATIPAIKLADRVPTSAPAALAAIPPRAVPPPHLQTPTHSTAEVPNQITSPAAQAAASASPSVVGGCLLPADWKSLQALATTDRLVYAGGRSPDGHGRLGIYTFAGLAPGFQDRSFLLPKTYGGVEVLALGGGHLLVAANTPGTRQPELAEYSPDAASHVELSDSLRLAASFEWWVTMLASNGGNFLIAGSGDQTPLVLFDSKTQKFTRLAPALPSYISTSAIAPDGASFLIDGVGAPPGSKLGTPPVLGRVSNSGVFTDLTPMLPAGLGIMLASGFDGREFLLQCINKNTKAQMFFLFDPIRGRFTDVSSSFAAPGLNVACLAGIQDAFVVGGRRGDQPYLALYVPQAGSLTSLANLLQPVLAPREVTAVAASGRYVAVGGVGRQGRAFLSILDLHSPETTPP